MIKLLSLSLQKYLKKISPALKLQNVTKTYFNSSETRVVKYPVITEKSTKLLEKNQYTFMVQRSCDKPLIKSAIEYLFDVKVLKVNTCNVPKKQKRVGKYIGWKAKYKKAIVTLADGNTINLYNEN